MKILIIIPAFNEEMNILNVLGELDFYYSELDYLVVNDCSEDATRAILLNKETSFLDLPVNLGIGGGVQAGYMYALENDYDIAVQMDGDGQHLPSEVSSIIDPIVNGSADFVVGSRFVTNKGFQSSQLRRIGIYMLSKVLRLCVGIHIKDVTSGFRAVNRKGISLFSKEYAQDYPEPEALAVAALKGLKIKEVPVEMKEREGGISSISGVKSIYYMIKVSIALAITRLQSK